MASPCRGITLLVDEARAMPEHHATEAFSTDATFVTHIRTTHMIASFAGTGANAVHRLGTPLLASHTGIAVGS